MNGDTPKIEIFKPFGEALELTKKILFQPFDLAKWFVIGFAAFLASLSGGMGFNFNGFNRKQDWNWKFTSFRHGVMETTAHWPVWVIPLIAVGVLFVLAFVVLCMWLGARGRFMFVDCIVRNRAAIVEPWREFRTEGNSFFLLSLLAALLLLVVAAVMAVPIFLPLVLHSSQFPFQDGDDRLAGRFRNDCAFDRPRMALDLAADGAGDVSQTMPCDCGFARCAGINLESSRAVNSLFPVLHRARDCDDRCRLRSHVFDVLHRGNPVHRDGDLAADSRDPLRVYASVSAAVRR